MADEPKKDDLDFLKDLGDIPPAPIMKRNRLGMSIQFFVVPALIVGLIVGIFLLFRFMTEETQSVNDLFDRMMNASGRQKAIYADSFVRKLSQERGDYKNPVPEPLQKMVPQILAAIRGLSGRELSAEEIDTKILCIKALGIVGNVDVAPDLASITDEEKNEIVQWEGLQTLGALKNPDSLETLRKYLNHSSPKTRKYAAFNIGAVRNPAAIPDLKQHLTDESVEVRWNSAFSLAYFLNDNSGVAVLLQMLDRAHVDKAVDPKEEHRDLFINHCMSLAAQAVAVIKEKSAIPLLEKAADSDPSMEVRDACRKALKLIK